MMAGIHRDSVNNAAITASFRFHRADPWLA